MTPFCRGWPPSWRFGCAFNNSFPLSMRTGFFWLLWYEITPLDLMTSGYHCISFLMKWVPCSNAMLVRIQACG